MQPWSCRCLSPVPSGTPSLKASLVPPSTISSGPRDDGSFHTKRLPPPAHRAISSTSPEAALCRAGIGEHLLVETQLYRNDWTWGNHGGRGIAENHGPKPSILDARAGKGLYGHL
ncbi:hypothetical protein TgHK011_009114 [Trichoderma gracile]|nr:hypothetical protein TgHK011_009114 [Trichoderma gracile]